MATAFGAASGDMEYEKTAEDSGGESPIGGLATAAGQYDFAVRREAMEMLRHKTGIIVDPNPASRTTLRTMLGAIGMVQVFQAASAADALRRVRERQADVILCDYQLDDRRDGQQLLEEMRSKHLIPLSTAFIVITRERRYQSVVSVAELAPDDYLLKPYSPQHLLDRIEAVLEKKHVFRHAHRHLEAGEAEAAIAQCDAISARHPPYRLDALRLKAETLMAMERTAEALALYQQILAFKVVPWAKMGLALARYRSGQLDEAADLIVEIVASHPSYLAAYDLAAKVDEERGRLAEAQQHLQSAVRHAPHGLARQRHLGQLAAQNNDMETAEAALRTVVDRAAGSSLAEVTDYSHLVRVQIGAGKEAAALETIASLRRDLRRDPAAQLVGSAMAAFAYSRLGKAEQAAAEAKQAMDSLAAAGGELPADLLVDVSQALIGAGEKESGESVLRRAIALKENDERFDKYMHRVMSSFEVTAGISAGVREDVRRRLIEINNEGVRLGQAGHFDKAIELFREAVANMPSVQMLANAAKAILAKMNGSGWDETLANEALGYLRRGNGQAPGDARIEAASAAFRQVAAKFGIKTEKTLV